MIPLWLFGLPLDLINTASDKWSLDRHLVAAIVQAESGGRGGATRHEKNYRWLHHPGAWAHSLGILHETEIEMQSTSWGVMQIMGATARDIGFTGYLPALATPRIGLDWGCKYLNRLTRLHYSMEDAIAAYNGGNGAVIEKENKGTYPPDVEKHVDRVMGYYRELTRIKE